MITRQALSHYLDDFLDCANFNDYAPNGLQIEGQVNIQRICTAVTASQAVIEKAIDLQADALLVHHGYFWRGENPQLTGMKRQRIGRLLQHNINLYAYHLPLDCHQLIGNNACLGQLLNVQQIKTHTAGKTTNLLWTGVLSQPLTVIELSHMLQQQLQQEPIHVGNGQPHIRHIGWCSGAAQDFIEEAHQIGVDAYLSGEISERTYYIAQELGIHYFACGHHASERYGIQALGVHLVQQFGLEHQFIDSDNPI